MVLLVTRLCGVYPGGLRTNRLNRVKSEVCRTHMAIHFVEVWLPVVADLLQHWHINWAFSTLNLQVIQVLLLSLFISYVRDSCCFNTILSLLLVKILECVFVEVDRLWSESLRSDLLILTCKLVVITFKSSTDFLRYQKFVHSTAVMG